MLLSSIDWVIVGVFFAIVLFIGWRASKTAGLNTAEFFLGGRGMPWWLLGVSMVACTFSADTPNLVTGFVRENGVAKNWSWWAFLITGMVTVFIYAKLWRRSGVLTDLEFYEKRYGGKPAAFLRIFRSLYLGLFFNVLIMGTVTLAAIKIGGVMLGIKPWVIVVGASIIVVIYSTLGGLKGVIWADFFQYGIAMFGAVLAAVVAVRQPEVGGLKELLSNSDSSIPFEINIHPYHPVSSLPYKAASLDMFMSILPELQNMIKDYKTHIFVGIEGKGYENKYYKLQIEKWKPIIDEFNQTGKIR